jgi:hypothetical protein
MMDIKGDFSGIAKEGIEKFITERHAKSIFRTKFRNSVELLTTQSRVDYELQFEFGLFISRILDLNDTQVVVLLFIVMTTKCHFLI